MSQKYHLYWKYFLLKHKPWYGNNNNSWDCPIPYPDKDEDALFLEDDNNSFVKRQYVDQFRAFQQQKNGIGNS